MTDLIPVFDGHNDILYRLLMNPAAREVIWLTGEGKGHLDLPRMQAGGFAGGLFAIYVPTPSTVDAHAIEALMDRPPYAVDLPGQLPLGPSQVVALEQAGHLLWMARASDGAFRLCRTAVRSRPRGRKG